MGLFSLFKKKEKSPEHILKNVHENRGLLWANIRMFKESLLQIEGSVLSGTEGMNEIFPVKHHLEDGLYTREIFMPKGSLVVSFIHKQNHPSFFLSGEMSVLSDTGDIKKIKAPMKVIRLASSENFWISIGSTFCGLVIYLSCFQVWPL